ncbi:DMT family transporter [Reichenbachiella versicolor]|uniref:DMT family transporter n=1 Tax=Reichenbachiella versicolor TaxID=1821036 RepID=UPI000D6E6FF5|nr:DMT family transporter [Reichenbachiella versicolor]
MTQSKNLGVALAIVGVVMFSAKAVMVKLAYQYEVEPVTLLLLRMIFALPIYIIVAIRLFQTKRPRVSSKDYLWLVFFGFVGYYLASYFDFLGLEYIKAGLERIILFVYPTLVVVFSAIFLRTKINSTQLIAILITYLGILVSFYGDLQIEGDAVWIGGGLIFLSATCYAGYLVGSGWLIPKFGATMFTSLAMIISCICVSAHFAMDIDSQLLNYPTEVYWYSSAMAILSTIIPSYLVSYAIKIIGAPNFSIIGSLGPISTILLAYFLLGESFSWLQAAGTSLVILGIWFVSKK